MALIETKKGRTILKNAESMMAVPYVYDASLGDYVLGNDIYDITAVIGDSIVIEQSDGDNVSKENEFVATPILEAYTNGKFAMNAQCIDLQDKVLRALFSAMTATSYNGTSESAAFCDDFVERYALLLVRFDNDLTPDVVMPKVMMNSRPFIQQLKTRAAQGNLSGTCSSKDVAVQDGGHPNQNALMQFSVPNGKPTYKPYTPLLFVPKGYKFFVRRDEKNYTYVNFVTGTVSNGIIINENNGTWSLYQQQGGGNSSGSSS